MFLVQQMYYPKIRCPVTNKIIKLYSDDVNKLLDQGYKIENFIPITYFSFFTNNEDMDFEIMSHVPIKQLLLICQLNKYSYKLLQKKHLWVKKAQIENIPNHFLNNQMTIQNYKKLFTYSDKCDKIYNDCYGYKIMLYDEKLSSQILHTLKLSADFDYLTIYKYNGVRLRAYIDAAIFGMNVSSDEFKEILLTLSSHYPNLIIKKIDT